MSDLISRQAILKYIEKKRQDALMIDDIRESSNIMRGMNLLEEAVRNQPSTQPSDDYSRGWEDGQNALREEQWENGRDRLD